MACFAAVGLRRRLRDCRGSEDGSLTVFSLVLFAVFALMCGLAVDVMRVEHRRVTLSQTLDRCALNAASLTQTIDPETVMRDCVDRAEMLPYLTSVDVINLPEDRSVAATGAVPVETFFINAMGIDTITVDARTRAEQGASNIEIVLVLDISGSMNINNRIGGLRTAAQNFIDTVLADSGGRVSIAIVPYAGQVNMGAALAERYNLTFRPGLTTTVNGDMRDANCVDFPAQAYRSTALSQTQPLPHSGWVDGITNAWMAMSFETHGRSPNRFAVPCQATTANVIRLPTDNADILKAHIRGLVVQGQTSINIGMKWGSALLDPSSRPVFDALGANNVMPSKFRDRPYDYSRRDVQKVVVLMTDGENMGGAVLNDAYRVGPSPIFVGTDGNFSIRFTQGRPASAGTNEYWVPHLDSNPQLPGREGGWQAISWGGTATTEGRPLTWQEAWQIVTPTWVAWHLYAKGLGTSETRDALYATWVNNFITRRGTGSTTPEMDAELSQICAATKQNGVLVYGVSFAASARGIAALQNCASSQAHFFAANNNAGLNAAFQAIALNIRQLRLTN